MNNDSKEPLKGKELRDLARSEPGQAFIYLENNKDLWVQIAETDPFDSADTLEAVSYTHLTLPTIYSV